MSKVTDNAIAGRYELEEQGEIAYADYRLHPGMLIIDYVFSPVPLRGKGTSARLMAGVVADAREKGLKITPLCGYAAAWIKRHPAASELLA